VGAHLVRALLERGDQVSCLVRSPAKARALGWTGVRTIAGDLMNAAALREGCAGADVVYHVAGAISARSPDEFMILNRDNTANVLEAVESEGSERLVYVSSVAAGGPNTPGQPVDEQLKPQPVTSYGRSKLAAELLVRASALRWTILRPPVVYGEWDRELLKVFRLVRWGVGPVFGDGSQELSIIYAGDLARALIAAGTTAAAERHVYYAAHSATTTSGGFVQSVATAVTGKRVRLLPVPAILARTALWTIGNGARLLGQATVLSADKANEFLAPAWTCRSDALTRDTGWTAEVPLDRGLSQTAAWYRQHKWI
jgi:nucleoside-diphosphate-sugar epimerase